MRPGEGERRLRVLFPLFSGQFKDRPAGGPHRGPADALLLGVHHIARWYGTRTGGLLYVLYVAQYFALILPAGVLCRLFPLLGRFDRKVRDLFRTAFQLTVVHLPSTVVIVLLTAQSAVFCIRYWWPVLFMPAAAMLLISLFTERVFQKYSPELAPKESGDPENPENKI